ncbi:MAG: hypothetical protein SVS15_11350, partial [Thermodesulfobacteriota bacterium]|nr:hypothetical protein [Thermodesulfobacteriota bacterium]
TGPVPGTEVHMVGDERPLKPGCAYKAFQETWEDARAELIKVHERRVVKLQKAVLQVQKKLEAAKKDLKIVQALREPGK